MPHGTTDWVQVCFEEDLPVTHAPEFQSVPCLCLDCHFDIEKQALVSEILIEMFLCLFACLLVVMSSDHCHCLERHQANFNVGVLHP